MVRTPCLPKVLRVGAGGVIVLTLAGGSLFGSAGPEHRGRAAGASQTPPLRLRRYPRRNPASPTTVSCSANPPPSAAPPESWVPT